MESSIQGELVRMARGRFLNSLITINYEMDMVIVLVKLCFTRFTIYVKYDFSSGKHQKVSRENSINKAHLIKTANEKSITWWFKVTFLDGENVTLLRG